MRSSVNRQAAIDIALVIDTLGRGGAERVLVSIANGLDPMRFRVHVIETRESGDLARELAPHVTLHSLGRRMRWDIMAVRRLAALFEQNGIRSLSSVEALDAFLDAGKHRDFNNENLKRAATLFRWTVRIGVAFASAMLGSILAALALAVILRQYAP